MNLPSLHIAVALLSDADGRMLVVRKRGTTCFMQPGGKIEPGEKPQAALARELFEELGLHLAPADLIDTGEATAMAVREPGWQVHAQLFTAKIDTDVAPRAEIEDVSWIDPVAPGTTPLAPLTRDIILPLLQNRPLTRKETAR